MRSRDLRIGNIVRCLAHLPIGFNAHKLLFTEIKEVRQDATDTTMGYYKYKDIAPITLTENILIKCEFKPDEGSETETKKYYIGEFEIYKKEDDTFGIDFGPDTKDIFKNYTIKYLHDLQNIYYDFTGKELYVRL